MSAAGPTLVLGLVQTHASEDPQDNLERTDPSPTAIEVAVLDERDQLVRPPGSC